MFVREGCLLMFLRKHGVAQPPVNSWYFSMLSYLSYGKFKPNCINRAVLWFCNLMKYSIYLHLFQCTSLKRHKGHDCYSDLRCRPESFSWKIQYVFGEQVVPMTTFSRRYWIPPFITYACMQAENVFFNFQFCHMEVMESSNSSPLPVFLAMKRKEKKL